MLQFLDEADLLADNIAVLAAPGKLVANGTPVTLKTSLGEGYSVQVKFSHDLTKNLDDLPDIRRNDCLPSNYRAGYGRLATTCFRR